MFYSDSYLKDLGIETLPRMEFVDGKMKDDVFTFTCTKSEYIDYCYEIISYLSSRNGLYYFGHVGDRDLSRGIISMFTSTYQLFPIDGYVVNEEINYFAYSLHAELSNEGSKDYNKNNLIEPISVTLAFNSFNKCVFLIRRPYLLDYQWTEQKDDIK